MAGFDLRDMMTAAERDTGLSDWGDEDFREPLTILVRSLDRETSLSDRGAARARLRLDNLLRQRLRVYHDRARRPEIAAQAIRAPLVMTGLPRAGTSFLNSLMAQDPGNLSPRGWQMLRPSPPPNDPAIDHEPQMAAAHRQLEEEGFLAPEIQLRHEYGALNAEEDGWLGEYQFLSINFPAFWSVPSYSKYLAGQRYLPNYRMHRRLLQALQLGSDIRRWTLKSPEHIIYLRDFLEVYPDANFVIHHRDPSKVVASVLSLLAAHHMQYSDTPLEMDRSFMSAFLDNFAASMERMIELRQDPAVNSHFHDIRYLDLERDPIAVVRGIHDRFGLAVSEGAILRMEDFARRNRKGKHGKHVYKLADFGFSQTEVHERFARYIRHFDVELEGGGQA
ncbi:MAG: sulfotransferase [Sphingomonadaceae bacterium]|nr:sulfotransferase [Sphingomonadaceae bacterium]